MLSFFYPYRFFEWKLQVAHRGSWKTKRIGAGFLQTPMCFAKSCDPNYPRNACKNPANARKSWFLVLEGIESFCKRCIFGNVWRKMSSIALTPILSVWICQLSSRACNPGLNRYCGLMVSLWGNHDDHNMFLQRSPCFILWLQIAAFF